MDRTVQAPRVAVVRHNQYPYEAHLRRDVLALRDAGFDVEVICDRTPGRPLFEQVDGVTILRMPLAHKRGGILRYLFEYTGFPLLVCATFALRSLHRRYAYIEVDNPPDWLIVAALLPKALGATVFLYLFENLPELFASDHNLPSTHPMIRALASIERTSARLADRVIVPYERARQRLIARGIEADKTVVVPNVHDEEYFLCRKAGTQDQRRQGDDRGFRLVTHSSLLERYGVQTLLEAVALLRSQIPGLQVEILGDGEYRPYLEALTTHLDLGTIVTFSGWVPDDEVVPRITRAHVGVVPMWADYSVPFKLMDYLALGLPVVASDLTVLREEGLTDGAVRFFETRNPQALAAAVLDLYANPARRGAMVAEGNRIFRERFAWKHTKHAYLAVYGVSEPECSRPAWQNV